MSPIISMMVGEVAPFVGASAKERIVLGTRDWTADETDPDILAVTCAHCNRSLHFSPSISRVSLEDEMRKHRAMYCHGEAS